MAAEATGARPYALPAPDARESAPTVVIDGGALGIESVVAVARGGAPVELAPEILPRLERARSVVERWAAEGRSAYGLTTGLGAAVDTPLVADDLDDFQRRALQARAVGVGEFLPPDEVRAMIFVRLAGIAGGVSGISPGFATTLRDMLNRHVHPLVRRTGSLGQADLAPLAEAMLGFAGGGWAEHAGRVLPAPEALAAAGIRPPDLGPKDAIALINANAFGVGLGALAFHDVQLAFDALTAAGALSLEAFRANLSVIDDRVVALRAAPGQREMSGRLRTLLAGSDLFCPGTARRVQDPLSFRCLAPVHGVVALRLGETSTALEAELAGAGDSPAVLVEAGEMLSTVNFDTTALALAFEALGQALAHAATISTFRTAKLMSPAVSDLPRFLANRGGSRTGFATAQKTASALEAAIRNLALPVGPMTAPVADGIEDYAPMTPLIVEKTRTIARHLVRLAAIELAVAAAATDGRQGIRLGTVTKEVHAFVRRLVPPFDDDRATGSEFERIAQAIEGGELRTLLAGPDGGIPA